jgi:hypothetical protein
MHMVSLPPSEYSVWGGWGSPSIFSVGPLQTQPGSGSPLPLPLEVGTPWPGWRPGRALGTEGGCDLVIDLSPSASACFSFHTVSSAPLFLEFQSVSSTDLMSCHSPGVHLPWV